MRHAVIALVALLLARPAAATPAPIDPGASLNIAELLNKSRGEYAYTLIDTDGSVDGGVIDKVRAISGVLAARVI